MKFIVKSIMLVLVVMFLVTTTSFTQTDSIGKTWVKTVEINKQFPNPDLVQPGDTVWVEIDGNKRFFIASKDSLNSQWAITVAALQKISINKDAPIKITLIEPGIDKNNIFLILFFAAMVFGFLGMLLGALMRKRHLDKASEISETITTEATCNPPILAQVPDFNSASDTEIHLAAENAIANTYRGRNFEIVGKVERGRINGKMKIFFADGSNRIEEFKNEPGYRTTVHFTDTDKTKVVVWRYSCFNPLFSANDANFSGTFTQEEEGSIAEPVANISEVETEELNQMITSKEEAILPDEKVPEVEKEAKNEKMQLTKLQISSDKGLNLEGDFKIEFSELKSLVDVFKNK